MLTTHVLDTGTGRPAEGMGVVLDVQEPDGTWTAVGSATTDADGRARDFGELGPGIHRLVFAAGPHLGPDAFYEDVAVAFRASGEPHLHVPLLLSPFGYSTYRGS